MKRQNRVMALIEKGAKFADEHQREIMLGGAIAGAVVTAVLSWNAGIKADKVMAKHKDSLNKLELDYEDNYEDEIFKEKKKELVLEAAKEIAPIVIPPVLAGAGTIISIICGYKVASTQIAVLSSLVSMSEKARIDYQEKAKELLGAKKAQEIADEVTADKVKKAPPENTSVINTGKGKTLCLDDMSGRYFYSSAEEIRKAFNTINKRMMDEYYISLNELYDELGLDEIVLGEDMGFNIDDGLIDIDHLFTAALHKTDSGEVPVLVLSYEVSGKYMEHRGRMFR